MTRRLQRRPLAETALTYDKAFALAQALKAADRSAKELEKGSGIHAVFQQVNPPVVRLSQFYLQTRK